MDRLLQIRLEFSEHGDIAVLKLQGGITVGGCEKFLRNTVRQVFPAKPRIIVLDFSRVNFIDSAAVGEMVGVLAACSGHEPPIKLKLMRVNGEPRRILMTTGLYQIFEIIDNEFQIDLKIPFTSPYAGGQEGPNPDGCEHYEH